MANFRAEAAASIHLEDRIAAIKEAKAETDRALARVRQESARAQALVGMKTCSWIFYQLSIGWRHSDDERWCKYKLLLACNILHLLDL